MNGTEIKIPEQEIIVSKTDPVGTITYGNRLFIELSGYTENELLGRPHNIIRHPDMPQAVFRLLWQTIKAGDEFFGLIKNRTKQGNFYWAFAQVTPSFNVRNDVIGFHSIRRRPTDDSIRQFSELYQTTTEVEQQSSIEAAVEYLLSHVHQDDHEYNEFILESQN